MTTVRCQAKNPDACRYHGTNSGSHVRVLRDKLNVAQGVYNAASTTDEKFAAYENVRNAEVEYYATEEGSNRLSEVIQESKPGDYRDMLIEIQARSQKVRTTNELDDSDNLMWGPPKPPAKPVMVALPKMTNLKSHLNYKGEMVHVLSEGQTPQGDNFDFSWNASNGMVSYGEKNVQGVEDLDSMRLLGRAGSLKEAAAKATRWYNSAVLR